MDFKYETITINKIDMNVIIDNDGVKWYPMSRFFQQVLKKAEEAKNFHNTAISKNMRLWPIKNPTPAVKNIWYIKESTLIKILKNIQINQYTTKTIERERALHGALQYFGIKRQNKENMYTVITPTSKDYSEWEMLCFEFDNDIKANIIWKMCDTCGRHFPCSKHYFQSETYARITNTCLECCGEELVNKNPDVQAMKVLNRMDLLPYIRNDKPVLLYKALERQHFPYEMMYFYNRSRLIEVLKYIEKRKRITGEGGFYLSKISDTLNIHTNKLKYIIGDSYEIGSTGPLPQHTYRYIPDDLTDEERQKKEFLERTREERKQAKRKRDIENYKKRKRMEHAIKVQEKINETIQWCRDNNFEALPVNICSKFFNGLEYAFITPEGIHLLTHENIDNAKIFIHKVPFRIDRFERLKEEMENAKKEYDS